MPASLRRPLSWLFLVCALACGKAVAPGEGDGGGDGGPDGGGVRCGDGVVQGNEECDQGAQNGPGRGCERDCTFSCIAGDPVRGDAKCDPHDVCKGHGVCSSGHRCTLDNPTPTGELCGTPRLICRDGSCTPAVCGDAIITAPEECDDGVDDGTYGCNSDCRYVCKSSDITRNCRPLDPCQGQGTCNDDSHLCARGTPLVDGTGCPGGVCKAGICAPSGCGNGVVDPGEECDFGAHNGPGTGCETNCKLSCTASPDSCPQGDPCSGGATCHSVVVAGETGQKCLAGTPLGDNTPCETGGKVCRSGVCVVLSSGTCGDGHLDSGEQCDWGSANAPGAGCELNCTFSCTKSPDSCSSTADACLGSVSCTAVTVSAGSHLGQKCQLGAPPAACTLCGTRGVCQDHQCKTSSCGDGCVDESAGEQCEPPGTSTCDAHCHTIAHCGNGIREGSEQCDDGNLVNLDGCDSHCRFEQDQRATSVQLLLSVTSGSICAHDAIGGAIQTLAAVSLQGAIDKYVKDGSLTLAFAFLGLTDPTGAGTQAFTLGSLTGKPVAAPAGATYDGTSDLDWWYATDPGTIDSLRRPLETLDATIATKVLTAGPGSLTLSLVLGGAPTPLNLSAVRVRGNLTDGTLPLSSAAATPGHLRSEHLDPALKSFPKLTNGELCGNVQALSLASQAVPASVSSAKCVEGYTAANSLLDVLVSGCTVSLVVGFPPFTVIAPTQPDQVDPDAAQAGAGGPYTLSVDPATNAVSGCVDSTKAAVDLQACLTAAAYSVAFGFESDRVILK